MTGMDRSAMANQSSSMGLNVFMGAHFCASSGHVNSESSRVGGPLAHLKPRTCATVAPPLRCDPRVFEAPLMTVGATGRGKPGLPRFRNALRCLGRRRVAFDARNYSFVRQAFGGARDNRVSLDPGNLGEVCDNVFRTADYDFAGASPISLLRFPGRPLAICRRITKVVISPLKRMAQRTGAHVGLEVGERVKPSFADGYSSAAIIAILLGVRTVAAALHRLPHIIYWVRIFERHKKQRGIYCLVAQAE